MTPPKAKDSKHPAISFPDRNVLGRNGLPRALVELPQVLPLFLFYARGNGPISFDNGQKCSYEQERNSQDKKIPKSVADLSDVLYSQGSSV